MHRISLQGRTYHYRRRVPKDLRARFSKSELFRSLSTASKREARYLAGALNLASERSFALAREDEKLGPERLRDTKKHAESGVAYLDIVRWAGRLKNEEAEREVAIFAPLLERGRREHERLGRNVVRCGDPSRPSHILALGTALD